MADECDDDVVRVAEVFAQVARTLAADEDEDAILATIVRLAVDSLEHCHFASISLVERRIITSAAATGEVPRTVDLIQSEVNEGPCLDAIREEEVFRTGDLAGEERWPEFAPRAHAETGICSILALRLFVDGDTLGAVNLYSKELDAFDDTDVALGSVFAAHAAVAWSGARRAETLEAKAASRDLIGRAKGILMARSDVSDDEAFDMLRRASQRLNVKLVDIAARVVERPAGDADGGS